VVIKTRQEKVEEQADVEGATEEEEDEANVEVHQGAMGARPR
jgi:hypothetical protein